MGKKLTKTIYESPIRSLVKSVTFRIIVLISDSIVVTYITRKESEVISFVIFTNLSSTIIYYLHERIWNNIFLIKNRSLIKSITFRIIVLTSDLIISTGITHSVSVAIGILVFTNLSSTILYYIHEKLWSSIKWGKIN